MTLRLTLKDPLRESALFRSRALTAGAFTLLLFLALIARLVYLQVVSHQHFTTLSHNNRVSVQPIAPTRGLIYDRNGVVLAENLPTFSLELVQERVQDLEATLATIRELIAVADTDVERFREELKRSRRFEEIPLRFRLSDEEVAIIAVNRHRLPGVEITSRLTRHYPLGALASHAIGYVGRISEPELKHIDPTNYSATNQIGKVGVEKSHEAELHGKVGYQQVETNARGRVLRVLERTAPVPGFNLHLNLDVRLQQAAEQAFGGERGALVAVEPETGAVLALVSVPGYDSNLFVDGVDPATYRALTRDRTQPLFNRALRGQYPPGSTIKPFVGLAGLELGEVKPGDKVVCPGYYTLKGDDRRYRDWKKEGHGVIDLHRSIVESCDVYFYDLALTLKIDRLSDYMKHFGFGKRTGLDIGGEEGGLMPSREWKRRAKREAWYPGETLITGIGQGFSLATPLQLATTTATLAARGRRLQPQVVQALEDPATGERLPRPPELIEQVTVKDPANWDRIFRAMEEVAHGVAGTARRIGRDAPYRIAGKTGTAQVFGIKQDEKYVEKDVTKLLRDHALFVGFAPVDTPRIAVAVIVENGGSGGAVASPLARQVMDRFLLDGEGAQ